MTVDFDSLMARQSIADIRTSVIAAANAVGFMVDRLPGLSRLRKLALDVVPVVVEMGTRINGDAIRGGLLDYAEDDGITLLARNLFGVERIGQTFATVTVTFTNTGAGSYNFADGEVVVSNGSVTYRAAAFSLSPSGSDGDEVDVSVTCTVAGSSGTTAAGTVDTLVTTFDGVECTNAAAANGTDEETDEQLRERCRLSRSALSNAGPVDAIAFVSRSATRANGSSIGVTRAQVVEDSPSMGDVAVYLADADGTVDSGDVTIIDGLLRTLVVPTGVNYLGTSSASTVPVAITYTARYKASVGFSVGELATMVEEALAEMFAAHPIGGYVESGPSGVMYRAEIAATIASVRGEESTERPIKSVTVSLPAGDVTLTPGQVAVLGTITPTWTPVT